MKIRNGFVKITLKFSFSISYRPSASSGDPTVEDRRLSSILTYPMERRQALEVLCVDIGACLNKLSRNVVVVPKTKENGMKKLEVTIFHLMSVEWGRYTDAGRGKMRRTVSSYLKTAACSGVMLVLSGQFTGMVDFARSNSTACCLPAQWDRKVDFNVSNLFDSFGGAQSPKMRLEKRLVWSPEKH